MVWCRCFSASRSTTAIKSPGIRLLCACVRVHVIVYVSMCACQCVCLLSAFRWVCGSLSHRERDQRETTLIWRPQRADHLSHTRGNTRFCLGVCACVSVSVDVQLCLPSISVIELGLWEIMILITHQLKGSRLSAMCCCFLAPFLALYLASLIFQWHNSYYCLPSPSLAFHLLIAPILILKIMRLICLHVQQRGAPIISLAFMQSCSQLLI